MVAWSRCNCRSLFVITSGSVLPNAGGKQDSPRRIIRLQLLYNLSTCSGEHRIQGCPQTCTPPIAGTEDSATLRIVISTPTTRSQAYKGKQYVH